MAVSKGEWDLMVRDAGKLLTVICISKEHQYKAYRLKAGNTSK